MKIVVTIFLFIFCLCNPVLAYTKHHHSHHYHHYRHYATYHHKHHKYYAKHHYKHHLYAYSGDARPRAWCGWYMRHLLGVNDRRYNLARNWLSYGYHTVASVGAIAVWPHHVGIIRGGPVNGRWLVESGNDGHAVRIRYRSLAGAIGFRHG